MHKATMVENTKTDLGIGPETNTDLIPVEVLGEPTGPLLSLSTGLEGFSDLRSSAKPLDTTGFSPLRRRDIRTISSVRDTTNVPSMKQYGALLMPDSWSSDHSGRSLDDDSHLKGYHSVEVVKSGDVAVLVGKLGASRWILRPDTLEPMSPDLGHDITDLSDGGMATTDGNGEHRFGTAITGADPTKKPKVVGGLMPGNRFGRSGYKLRYPSFLLDEAFDYTHAQSLPPSWSNETYVASKDPFGLEVQADVPNQRLNSAIDSVLNLVVMRARKDRKLLAKLQAGKSIDLPPVDNQKIKATVSVGSSALGATIIGIRPLDEEAGPGVFAIRDPEGGTVFVLGDLAASVGSREDEFKETAAYVTRYLNDYVSSIESGRLTERVPLSIDKIQAEIGELSTRKARKALEKISK